MVLPDGSEWCREFTLLRFELSPDMYFSFSNLHSQNSSIRAHSVHDLPREGEAIDDLTREANEDRIRVMILYGLALVVPSFGIDMKDFLSEDHLYETISDAVIPHLDDPIPISCWPAIIDEIVRCGFSLASNATDIELRVRYGIEVYIDEEYYSHNSHDDINGDDDDYSFYYGLSDGSDDDYLDYDDDDDMGVRMTREDVMKGLEKVTGVAKGTCVFGS
ncbi:hypothetical protein Droror1_Dr00011108 [Drosera rotundifolia]